MTRDDALSLALREKTLALMRNPSRPRVDRPQGHRQWTVPLAERKR